ncbi:cell adhesion molecule Dscam2-like isoform X4 [Neocloeon triangulifer]|uniref:cell adhesion molecule Dscam2-like isoform X4 n=1 Tax=Neocloeon triangulifer TaxID=2078957 RepID=UPI00286EC852|nr:cell adhesion molecule Dscam2-like isoform X4 [Neocloeon triangulifer]
MMIRLQFFCLATLVVFGGVDGLFDTQGPNFVVEPPPRLEFTNSHGGRVDCLAQGNPEPKVEWVSADGSPLSTIPGVRMQFGNGSLYFPPFHAEIYRQDVHASVYKCVASVDSVGTIVSRDVVIRAVVNQHYEPEVQNPGGIVGNTVIMRCTVPAFVKDYVTVTSWLQEPNFNIYPSTVSDGKYHMLPNGELLINDVSRADSSKGYRCRTHHQLTQESVVSINAGRIQLTDIRGLVHPILYDKLVTVTARVDDTVVIPCVAYANPRPSYRWFHRTGQNQQANIDGSGRMLVREGTLVIPNVKQSDAGSYFCNASNSQGSEVMEVKLAVNAPLAVTMQPNRLTVDLGRSAEISCVISGFPHGTPIWLKDGQPLRISSRVRLASADRLHLGAVSKEDRGMYQCVVRSEHDMAQGSVELRLGEVYPQLVYRFIEQTLQPGPSVSLKCSASGNPTPQITWTLDGFPLPHGNDRLMIGQFVSVFGDVISHVNISSVRAEDGGEYECVAENRAGTDRHSARLNVYGQPYVRPMPSISAVAGKRLEIKCPVAGYPIDTIIWEKDDVRLPTNIRQKVTNGSLIIENVQRNLDSGSYMCLAKNKQNYSSQRSVDIRVLVPPRVSPFYFDAASEGLRTQVMCTTSQGDQPFVFSWLKDGRALQPGDGLEVIQFTSFSSILTIDSVRAHHSGNYSCQVQNAAATVEHTAALSVTVPPRWVVEPSDQSVVLGKSVVLQCQADGFPKPTVTWKQAIGKQPGDYREIGYRSQRLRVMENGSLVIARATEENEGYFLCQASNGIGAGLSKVIHLNVYAAPRFKTQSKSETVRKGATVHLKCEAEGDNPMDIAWKLRGIIVDSTSDARFSVKKSPVQVGGGAVSELTILDANHRDRGEYVCVATNEYGSDTQTNQLMVQEPPNFPRNLHITEQTSRSIVLSWASNPDANIPITSYVLQFKESNDVWHEHNAQQIIPGDKTTAAVEGLKPATMYQFRLYAENQLGASEPSDILHGMTSGENPAGPPLQVSVEPVSSTQLRVTWQPPDRELWNGDILGYNIGFKKVNHNLQDNGFNFTRVSISGDMPGDFRLTNLEKFTKYSVVVQAVNSIGEGPNSDPFTVLTLEDVPSGAPQEVKCSALTSQSIQVTWQPPLMLKVHGIIQGYRVTYEPAEEWSDSMGTSETRSTAGLNTILHGLQHFTNYSVQVLAYTRAGDGVKSTIVFCRTEETVPEAPERVKAAVSSPSTVIISWLPPRRPNGVLTKYTVHLRSSSEAKDRVSKWTLPPTQTQYMVQDIRKRNGDSYEAWVTASTKIGQGQNTPVVKLHPSSSVPAAIVSFGQAITVPWKVDVKLPCQVIGIPRPSVDWKKGDMKIQKEHRVTVSPENTLVISSVQRAHDGNYTCYARNNIGTDHITFALRVQVPPTQPILLATAVTANSVQLQWKQGDNGGAPVKGFLLSFKRDSHSSEWEDVSLDKRLTTYLLDNLDCGTQYQFKLTAFNKIGNGVSSKTEVARTSGTKPAPPTRNQFLQPNMSAVVLYLNTWSDGGCPVQHFAVELRKNNADWQTVSSSVTPQPRYLIEGLEPSTKYFLRVTAHNNAGTAMAEFDFETMHQFGGVTPSHGVVLSASDESSISVLDPQVLLPSSIAVAAIFLVVAGFCYCWRRKPDHDAMQESQASMAMDNKQNMEQRELQYYATVRKPMPSPIRDISTLERIPEYSEDIYPYATFHLPEQENMASNPQLQALLYNESQHAAETLQMKQVRSRSLGRGRGRRKSFKSESEEYDTLGSEDEEEPLSSRTESSSQLHGGPPPLRPHLNFLYHNQESSTSTEPSPISERKSNRHGKVRSGHISRRAILDVDNVHSPRQKTDLPNGFHEFTLEPSEAECDMDSLKKLRLGGMKFYYSPSSGGRHNLEDFTIAV